MSIIKLKKITVCGLLKEKDAVLAGLQQLGCMHLESLRGRPVSTDAPVSERAEDVKAALRHLEETPRKRIQVKSQENFDVDAVVRAALANKQAIRDVGDQRDFLRSRIHDLQPWGDFRLPPRPDLDDYLLWFYVVPNKDMAAVRRSGLTWQIVHQNPRVNYLVVIAREEPPADALPVRRTATGAKSLSTLRAELENVEIELERLAAERESLTHWIYLLHHNFNRSEDKARRRHAAQLTLDTEDGLVTVHGWAPALRLDELERFAERQGVAMVAEDPGPYDHPPTLMDNPGPLQGGEALVSFYQTPAYREWDPSQVVLFSFATFFAMILADAGYALVLLGGLLPFWRRLSQPAGRRQLRDMMAILCGASVCYGVLVGSYFGLPPPAGSWLERLQVLDLQDFDTMMTLSIVVGACHVILANAMAARLAATRYRRIHHVAWIAVIVGGLLIWLGGGPDAGGAVYALGLTALGAGIVALVCFTSGRRVDSPRTAALRLLDGLKNLSDITQIFGDVLSYMRLFALGLASASMAMTFNQLAVSTREAMPGLGLLFALLILVFGHAINLALCIMGGVVHGLRLNVIEFFKWGLAEEGRPFHAYAKKETEQ